MRHCDAEFHVAPVTLLDFLAGELKKRGDTEQDALDRLGIVKEDVTRAISTSHGLTVADLVLVQPGSIPTTTSGKIRRSTCVEHYRGELFTRLDA